MNKITAILLTLTASVGFLLGQTLSSKADNRSFSGVMPFMTAGGYFGLFDQNNGKVYLYDDNIKKCVFKARFDELGKPTLTDDDSAKASSKEAKKDVPNETEADTSYVTELKDSETENKELLHEPK